MVGRAGQTSSGGNRQWHPSQSGGFEIMDPRTGRTWTLVRRRVVEKIMTRLKDWMEEIMVMMMIVVVVVVVILLLVVAAIVSRGSCPSTSVAIFWWFVKCNENLSLEYVFLAILWKGATSIFLSLPLSLSLCCVKRCDDIQRDENSLLYFTTLSWSCRRWMWSLLFCMWIEVLELSNDPSLRWNETQRKCNFFCLTIRYDRVLYIGYHRWDLAKIIYPVARKFL